MELPIIKMEQVRSRADEVVEDKDTAEALKPYYRQFCKRPCFHDEYLPTFNRPNVTLIHTDGKGVDQIKRRNYIRWRGIQGRLHYIRDWL